MIGKEDKIFVGVILVEPGAEESTHAATIAAAGQVPLGTLWHALSPFPTISAIRLNFLLEYGY